MASAEGPAPETHFWAALGIGQEDAAEPEPEHSTDEFVAGSSMTPTAPTTEQGSASAAPAAPAGQADWAGLFSEWGGGRTHEPAIREPEATGPAVTGPAVTGPAVTGPAVTGPAVTEPVTYEPAGSAPAVNDLKADELEALEPAPHVPAANDQVMLATATKDPAAPNVMVKVPTVTGLPVPSAPAALGPEWEKAERLADELRPRTAELWLEVLTRFADGDAALAHRVYHVLSGTHLLGELWTDQSISEVHVHGTRVTVCGGTGVREVPGFPSEQTARRAIEAVKAARREMHATVTEVGDSVVVSRTSGAGSTVAALIASGVVTEEQVAGVREALESMQAVIVTGPAAWIIVRAFAPLVPPGSRVFQGPHAVLPPGCLAATDPLDADYVIGVRLGAVAEGMAAAGQVGALMANPETQFTAKVRLVVSGRSSALGKVVVG